MENKSRTIHIGGEPYTLVYEGEKKYLLKYSEKNKIWVKLSFGKGSKPEKAAEILSKQYVRSALSQRRWL